MPLSGQNTFFRLVRFSARRGASSLTSASVVGALAARSASSPVWRAGMPHSAIGLSSRNRTNTGNRSVESSGHSR